MPNYAKLRELVGKTVTIQYDTGAKVVGRIEDCKPDQGPVQLLHLAGATVHGSSGAVLEQHNRLTVCPNAQTRFDLEEGPSGRDEDRL